MPSNLRKPQAKLIAFSRAAASSAPPLMTFSCEYWKAIHGEVMTHRVFSRNAGSSRAIKVEKLLAQASDLALRTGPVKWNFEQKGMQGTGELDPTQTKEAEVIWNAAADAAISHAKKLAALGVHKSIVNRLLEPFTSINTLITTCDIDNFLGLRLDKDADPTINWLAQEIYKQLNERVEETLTPGEWHLPYIDAEDWEDADAHYRAAPDEERMLLADAPPQKLGLNIVRRVSVARCARVSYQAFETGKRSTIVADLKLYDRLLGAQPLHASPAEHQATPDETFQSDGDTTEWLHASEHGNLRGWRQWRKMLPGEACAPLPHPYFRTW